METSVADFVQYSYAISCPVIGEKKLLGTDDSGDVME